MYACVMAREVHLGCVRDEVAVDLIIEGFEIIVELCHQLLLHLRVYVYVYVSRSLLSSVISFCCTCVCVCV